MKIGIIGLGLIGGSLFKDLSEVYDVVAVSQSQNGDRIFKTFDVLKDRDIVFVCTAMNNLLVQNRFLQQPKNMTKLQQ